MLYWVFDNYLNDKTVFTNFNLKYDFLILSVFFYLIHYLIISFRLKIILKIIDFHLSIKNCFHLTMIGQFFNQLLPSSIGGDAIKIIYLNKINIRISVSTISILYDRLLGFLSLFLIVLVGQIIFKNHFDLIKINNLIILSLSIVLITSMLFIFYKLIKTNKIKTKFKKYFNIIIDLIFNFKHFFSIFSISLLSQIVELIGIYFFSKISKYFFRY